MTGWGDKQPAVSRVEVEDSVVSELVRLAITATTAADVGWPHLATAAPPESVGGKPSA
jgi:hypothetical protein